MLQQSPIVLLPNVATLNLNNFLKSRQWPNRGKELNDVIYFDGV